MSWSTAAWLDRPPWRQLVRAAMPSPASRPLDVFEILTFRELRTATSTTKTVFLALLHSGISGQVATIAQRLKHFFVVADEGSGDAHATSTRLPGRTATVDTDDHIHFSMFTHSM